MINLTLGIVFGIVTTRMFYRHKQNGRKTPWQTYLLYALATVSIVFFFDVVIGSIQEHEIKAAWMGGGMSAFGCLICVVGGKQIEKRAGKKQT